MGNVRRAEPTGFWLPTTGYCFSVSADVRQKLRGGALEEGFVEEADGLFDAALLDDEGQVDGGRALRDEQDVDVLDGREDAARDAGRRAQSLADDADDGAVGFDADGGDALEVFEIGRAHV